MKLHRNMEIGQDVLNALPPQQRLRLVKQLRQEQVKRYNEWIKAEKLQGVVAVSPKKNKKGANIGFGIAPKLSDATLRFDDREVISLLNQGADPNYANPTGLTLLHKCCLEDNLSVAEILISYGASVDAKDDDQWTPLHFACEFDNSDIVQFLLSKGADTTILDIDGNFAVDHATEGSYAHILVQEHLKKLGITESKMKEIRNEKPNRMLNDVRNLLQTNSDINAASNEGTTLLHIACANGYRQVASALVNSGKCNVEAADVDGWTSLHCAVRYGQLRMVKFLLKHKADPRAKTNDGLTAAFLTKDPDILAVLYKAAKRRGEDMTDSAAAQVEQDVEEDEPSSTVFRISSKIIKSKHNSMAKTDQVYEGNKRQNEFQKQVSKMPTAPAPSQEQDSESEEEYEDIYVGLSFGRQKTLKPIQAALPIASGTDDLATLAEISETILVAELRKRYNQDHIYTNIGDILVAVNPFKDLPVYGKPVSVKYNEATSLSAMVPHVYGVAERTYRGLLTERKPQCCVISGESGAGKTESSKYIVQHLLSRAASEETNLNIKIQQVNPLLEAFGNSRTVMNDNSSRFGKYLELLFTADGFVQGAKVHEYLLEKSRVVYQSEGETNFHIFYLLFSGLSPDEYEEYGLQSAKSHRYLQTPGININAQLSPENTEKFSELRECLKFIGFTRDDIRHLLLSLSAVLHMGDIKYEAQGNNDSAQITNWDLLRKVAAMLQVPAGDLGSSLVSEVTMTRGEQIKKERSMDQASECRDALAKAIYGRLFSWIVNSINQLIQPAEGCESSIEIGILDIFGFENFAKNSFEQLCINLANEQLQSYFNQHIFDMEMNDCLEEGIPMSDIHFTNNKPVLDLFLGKPVGLLSILDEESRFPKATDKSLATKLHTGPGKMAPEVYLAPKDGGLTFSIMHYAGKVSYSMDGVLDKNRDTLPTSILFTMKASNSLLVKEMFQSRLTRTGSLAPSQRQQKSRKATEFKSPFDFFKRKRTQAEHKPRRSKMQRPVIGTERKGPSTQAYHFKNSLAELMGKMNASSPHFVRCIKPNMSKVPSVFEVDFVKAQLRYTGVMETVRIRREGYAMRITFSEFIERYSVISTCYLSQSKNQPDLVKCKTALKACNLNDYKVGKTKLFFRYWHVEKLSEVTRKLERQVGDTQRITRGWLARKHYKRMVATKQQQDDFVRKFLVEVESKATKLSSQLLSTQQHDIDRSPVKRPNNTSPKSRDLKGRKRITQSREECKKQTARRTDSTSSVGCDDVEQTLEVLDGVLEEAERSLNTHSIVTHF